MMSAARDPRGSRVPQSTSSRVLAALAAACVVALTACTGGPALTPLPSGADLPTDCAEADANNVITLSARNLRFSAPCLLAPADEAFTIRFTNEEAVPHDVALYRDASRVNEYFRGEVFAGPNQTRDYMIDPIPAGDHYFDCTVHPADMNGALYVR